MRQLSEKTKNSIIKFTDEYYIKNGYTPTIATISKHLQLSESAVHKYLHRMTDTGELFYDGKHILTPRIKAAKAKEVIEISGQIACGNGIYAQQEYGDTISLPSSLVEKGNYFVLRTRGDSMVNIGINDNDLVIIKQQNYAIDGQVVAVLIDEENATLKRYTIDHKNKMIVLLPENEEYKPIVRREEDIHILGILVYLLKDMNNI